MFLIKIADLHEKNRYGIGLSYVKNLSSAGWPDRSCQIHFSIENELKARQTLTVSSFIKSFDTNTQSNVSPQH